MPIGCYSLVPEVVSVLEAARPDSILDCGAGMGFYAAAVRQWLDFGVQPFRTYLMGIEAFGAYRNPLWSLYSCMHVMRIQDYLKWPAARHDRFDAILLMDVIEHVEKSVGYAMIHELRARLHPSGRLLVGTPAVFAAQGAVNQNDFERHRSQWSAAEFHQLGFEMRVTGTRNRFGHQMLFAIAR